MIEKTRLWLGQKVKFGYSWLVPANLHHTTATIVDAQTEGGQRRLLMSAVRGSEWMSERRVSRAGKVPDHG
jgi:hypothetical protein